MTRSVGSHRLVATTIATVLVVLGAGAVLLAAADGGAGASAPRARDAVLGPGPVTVRIDVDHSHFRIQGSTGTIRVRPHTDVRFVVVNHDPIGHELIVGGPDVQARHASGHEAYHPPVSGEVSVPADGRASTMYSFHFPGPVEYACHLPGHYQYGMHGIVEVVDDAA